MWPLQLFKHRRSVQAPKRRGLAAARRQLEDLECRRLYSGSPAITIGDVSLAEGQDGASAYVFNVSLSKASSKRVSVDFATANGSAQVGEDYAQTSGTLTFARGQRSKTVTVMVNGDTAVEESETFSVVLRRASNARIADSRGLGTIVNDDVLPPPPPYEPPADPWYDPGYDPGYDTGWWYGYWSNSNTGAGEHY